MKKRMLLLFSLLPFSAVAQVQLFTFDGTNEMPVNSLVEFGTAAPNDKIPMRFKLHNAGTAPATLQTLGFTTQQGTQQVLQQSQDGFQITAVHCSLPCIIAPSSGTSSDPEFDVTFQAPLVAGQLSANLQVNTSVNTINVILRAVLAPSAVVLTLTGSQTPLIVGGPPIDFGSVQVGNSQTQGFTLTNPGAASVTVNNVSVSGEGFSGGLAGLVQIPSKQSVSFQVAFSPQTGQPAQGTLTVDLRSFVLTGNGLNPTLPSAAIVLASTLGASVQQNSVSITLASASQVSGTGTLSMQFQSSVPGVTDDAAIRFLSGPKRAATVTISAGDSVARFGGQSSIAFQTGSTAGTIVFTLTLGNAMQQSNLVIAPVPVRFDMSTSIRKVGELDVSLTGFDNTYSASQLAFTFYDPKGGIVQPGVIHVDATADFRQYFAAAATGGMFGLLARFPVTGDTSQIASVDVQITNSAGATTAQKIPIGN